MDLRRVRTFVTVAELGTVTKAALRLGIAQPALSRQVCELEEELGIKLFDRVGRRLLLSSEGAQLLGQCHGLLAYAESISERARVLQRGDAGTLRVSSSPHLIEGIFPGFLHRYKQQFPNVRVELVDVVGPDMLPMLERGEIHLAQSVLSAVPPEDSRFTRHPLQPMQMLAASHLDLDLGSNSGTIDIGRLERYPLLQISSEFVIRRTFDAACRLAGFKPNVIHESRAPHALLALAEAKHGVAIIPSALRTHRYALRIVVVTYRGKPLRESLTMLSDRRRLLPIYATVFCDMLAKHLHEVFPLTGPSVPAAEATRKGAGRKLSMTL
jgi:DNA-binding transcriptional LysR family regulator